MTSVYIRHEMTGADLPMEFMRLAIAHLDAAHRLTALMSNGSWRPDYYRGQVVLWLTFQAIELTLKACILELKPGTNVRTHSLDELTEKVKRLAPHMELGPFFRVKGTSPHPLTNEREKARKFHEVFRYPMDPDGQPWPGMRGFSMLRFRAALKDIRADCEQLFSRVFGNSPAGGARCIRIRTK